MKIEIRGDVVHIEGYVNAVGRDSRPVITEHGKVVEQVVPGTFKKALLRAVNIDLLLNHNKEKKLGSTKEGNLLLLEYNIGLRASCTISDPEIAEKARKKQLIGWSFGMQVNKDDLETRSDNLPRRLLTDIDMFEVSLIDERMRPVYEGTSVEVRAFADEITTVEDREEKTKEKIDYSEYENRINKVTI